MSWSLRRGFSSGREAWQKAEIGEVAEAEVARETVTGAGVGVVIEEEKGGEDGRQELARARLECRR